MPTTKTTRTKTPRRATTPGTAATLPGPKALAHATTTPTLPPLPLYLRFPPAVENEPEECESPEVYADSAACLARDAAGLLPLVSMDGPALLAHISTMDREARAALSSLIEGVHSSASFLNRTVWPLACRFDTLCAYLDTLAGRLHPDPLARFDRENMTPEGSARWVRYCAAQAWGDGEHRNDYDPMYMPIGGKPGRWWPEVDTDKARRTTFCGVPGWAVPIGPDPDKPIRWAFVPDDRAAGAPELAGVVGG